MLISLFLQMILDSFKLTFLLRIFEIAKHEIANIFYLNYIIKKSFNSQCIMKQSKIHTKILPDTQSVCILGLQNIIKRK